MIEEEKRQQKIKKKKFWRILLVISMIYFSIPIIILSFIGVLHIIPFISSVGSNIHVSLNEEPWIEQQSFCVDDQNEYELSIYEIGSPFTFGASECMAVLKCNNKKITQYEFYVSNDGKTLYEDNFNINWYDDCVVLEVNGEEQATAYYKFFYNGSFHEMK